MSQLLLCPSLSLMFPYVPLCSCLSLPLPVVLAWQYLTHPPACWMSAEAHQGFWNCSPAVHQLIRLPVYQPFLSLDHSHMQIYFKSNLAWVLVWFLCSCMQTCLSSALRSSPACLPAISSKLTPVVFMLTGLWLLPTIISSPHHPLKFTFLWVYVLDLSPLCQAATQHTDNIWGMIRRTNEMNVNHLFIKKYHLVLCETSQWTSHQQQHGHCLSTEKVPSVLAA